MVNIHYSMSLQRSLADSRFQIFSFLDSQWEGWSSCYCASFLFQNASRNIYDKKNPFKSAYVISIDQIDFRIDLNQSLTQEKDKSDLLTIFHIYFEDNCSIVVTNSFNVLDNFDTDINEFILINKESTSITEDFHED